MGEKIKDLMKEKGVTAYQVSKAIGVPTSSIYEWVQGKHSPRIDKLALLADFFGVPLEYFVKN